MTGAADARPHVIEWDMGDYGPFDSYDEARAYQREHKMTGSVVVPV
ncbi:hypothetical protein I5G63_gp100 [Mycobacterium phage Imvubu]|uniref:Uncharacterized protein n=1 Tax=Mycobacterium phage Imvubu TaxID=2686233 RepID=A0A6B9L886_9CAUD|nr:hypothetical protein I5G63_gp100 [Mycobacterium phage Imvubu]QHB37840.1 hypothetical protein PBI_IMVUBU_100 [Mycobacterium phage Imvubu]